MEKNKFYTDIMKAVLGPVILGILLSQINFDNMSIIHKLIICGLSEILWFVNWRGH